MASTGRWYTSIFPKLGSFLNSPVGIDTLSTAMPGGSSTLNLIRSRYR